MAPQVGLRRLGKFNSVEFSVLTGNIPSCCPAGTGEPTTLRFNPNFVCFSPLSLRVQPAAVDLQSKSCHFRDTTARFNKKHDITITLGSLLTITLSNVNSMNIFIKIMINIRRFAIFKSFFCKSRITS